MTFFERLQDDTAAERNELLGIPVIREALRGHIRLEQYLAFLREAYHHVSHTVPLLMACGARLPRRLAWLREALVHYIDEEQGHEEWILADIAACGRDAEEVRHGRPRPETEFMVAYAYHQVDRRNPIGLLGMVHVLEGTSAAIATCAATAIRSALQLPPGAFTYLTSHGNLDVEHVQFFQAQVSRIAEDSDRHAVVHCARAFYRLYGDVFRALPAGGSSAVAEAA